MGISEAAALVICRPLDEVSVVIFLFSTLLLSTSKDFLGHQTGI